MDIIVELFGLLSEKTPEFVIGFAIGALLAFILAYMILLPKMVKSATESLTAQVGLLSTQVNNQTNTINHLQDQISKLEGELEPYRQFAEQQLNKLTSTKQQ
ncbi:hypothetical protein [Paraglaciecola sp.]|uniref:hypothetical protein n=1 Tax=Paraglaciecola sp. TaxID=1920173 RepID=UPI003EF4E984